MDIWKIFVHHKDHKIMAKNLKRFEQRLIDSTFKIINDSTEIGTGFFISQDGNILTAYHCIEEKLKPDKKDFPLKLEFNNGDELVTVFRINEKLSDKSMGLAMGKVKYTPIDHLPLGTITEYNINDNVVIAGYPAADKKGHELGFYKGSISRFISKDLFEVIGAIQGKGVSGAPVFHEKTGHVIGLVQTKHEPKIMANAGNALRFDSFLEKWTSDSDKESEESKCLDKCLSDTSVVAAINKEYSDAYDDEFNLKRLDSQIIALACYLRILVGKQLFKKDILFKAYRSSVPKYYRLPDDKNEEQIFLKMIKAISSLSASKSTEGVYPLVNFACRVNQNLNFQEKKFLKELIDNCGGCPKKLINRDQPIKKIDMIIMISPSESVFDCYSINVYLNLIPFESGGENNFFEQKDLKDEIIKILKKAYSKLMFDVEYNNLDKKDVWIRFFLPRQLLLEGVDQYEVGIYKRLGAEFKVTVSLWERAKHPEYTVPVITRWNKCQADFNKPVLCTNHKYASVKTHIQACIIGKDNLKYADDPNTAFAILTFTPKVTEIGTKMDILNQLFYKGVPVILWVRSPNQKCELIIDEISNLIGDRIFNELPNQIYEERLKAYTNYVSKMSDKKTSNELPNLVYDSSDKEYQEKHPEKFGNLLTLLWDDANLIKRIKRYIMVPYKSQKVVNTFS